MAFRFAPTELYSSANKGCQFLGLIRWNGSAWVFDSPRPRFSVSGTDTIPVISIPGVEGTFCGAIAQVNTGARTVNSCIQTQSGSTATLTITLSGAAASGDRVAFQAVWDEQPIRS